MKRVCPDGRAWDEIRPISSEVQLLNGPMVLLFYQRETQVLNICTLGASGICKFLDGWALKNQKGLYITIISSLQCWGNRFMRGPGRREIGHGSWPKKPLKGDPGEEEFPTHYGWYRGFESPTVLHPWKCLCRTLSLMDAGVPIKAPVSGIAMGLIKEDDKIAILSDIQGIEDFAGDMDFKVARTKKGITALQMDIKIKGLSREILKRR